MPSTHDRFGNPIPKEPTPPRKHKKKRQFANQLPTDILVWLSENGPETYEELKDLRLALYGSERRANIKSELAASHQWVRKKSCLPGQQGRY